jgi:hypothetical protein
MKVHLAHSSFWERYVDWRNVQSWEVEKGEEIGTAVI